ncbi:Multidrug resistance-associated protein 4, partial [Gryganskiella cystojenkinii]
MAVPQALAVQILRYALNTASLALALFISRIYRLRAHRTPHNYGRTAWIYWPTQLCIGATSILMLTQSAISATGKHSSVMNTVGTLTMGVAWALCLIVNYDEHRFTIRSSNSLLSFYTFVILATLFILHTLFDLDQTNTTQFHLTLASLFTLTAGWIVEAWPRSSTRVQQQLPDLQGYEKANLFAQLTMFYFQPIVSLAAKQEYLSPADIVNILPNEHKTEAGTARLEKCWNKRMARFHRRKAAEPDAEKRTKIKPPSFFTTVLIAHWVDLIPIVIARTVTPFIENLSPLLLGILLDYIEGRSQGGGKPLAFGLFIAVSIFVVHMVITIFYSYMLRKMYLIGTEVRSATTAMIYRKALRLSPDARRKSSVGAISNHMSVDAASWEMGIDILSLFISLPWDFSLCIFLLYRLVGWSAFAGVATLLVLTPLQIWRAKYFGQLEEQRLKATDERVRQTTEILSNIKIIKLYGWEIPMRKRILDSRNKELRTDQRLGALEALMSLVFASSAPIISLVTFACYVTLGHGVLTPKIVFVSLTLMELLHEPIGRLAEGSSETISLVIANRRIRRFLLREEIDETQIEHEEYKVGEDN